MSKKYICDCGKQYTPSPKYKDDRVKCNNCIKNTKAIDIKKKCIKYLGGKCKDCRNDYHPVCMDFDHKDKKTKEYKISGHYLFRWAELRKELDKTELRCSNCHRLKHYMEDNG